MDLDHDLDHQPIRIAAPVEEPYSFDCFPLYSLWNKSLCPRPGSEIEFLSTLIVGFLNLSIQWIKVDSYAEMEEYVNSSKADVQGLALSLALSDAEYKSSNSNQWFHTPVYSYDYGGIYVKLLDVKEVAEENWLKSPRVLLFESFHWNIWFMMAIITLAAVGMKRIAKKIHHYTVPAKLTNVWWFIEVSALLSIFSNIMAIGLVQPTPSMTYPFETLDKLAERLMDNTCKLVMVKEYNSTEFYSLFQPTEQNSTYSRSMSHIFSTKSYVISENYHEFAALILSSTNHMCYVGLHYASSKEFLEGRHCRIKLFPLGSSEQRSFVMYAFYHKLEKLSKVLQELMAADAIQAFNAYAVEKYYKPIGFLPCDIVDASMGWQPVSLKKVIWSLFAILVMGFAAGFIGLSVELLVLHCYDYVQWVCYHAF